MKKSDAVKYFYFTLSLIASIICVLYSAQVKNGIITGLKVCSEALIPSLFPFFCVCFFTTGLAQGKSGFLSRLFSAAFKLPPEAGIVFLLSMISGYPGGIIMVNDLFKKGILTRSQAKRMCLFSCSSGPAFCVIAVGEGICSSKKTGLFLLISNIVSQIIIGLVLSLFSKEKAECKEVRLYEEKKDYSALFTDSVEKSINSVISVCAYVLIFSAVGELIGMTKIKEEIKRLIFMLLEVTTGCIKCGNKPIMLAFILGFGGFCVFFQIKKHLQNTGARFFHFVLSRLASGLLSAGIYFVLLTAFPVAAQTMAEGIKTVHAVSFSAPISALLVFSFAVFILDNKKNALKFQNPQR